MAEGARASLLVVLCVSVAGCTGREDDNSSSARPSGELTFDLWLGDKVDFVDYAVRELNADCMARAGYPQLQQVGNRVFRGASTMFAITAERFRGFASEADARAQGFGNPQHAELRPLVSNDPSCDKQLDECTAKTYESLGADASSILDAYNTLGNQMAMFNNWSRTAIRTSLPPFVDCLEKAGFRLKDRDYFINTMWDIELFGIPLGKLEGEPYGWKPSRKPGTVEVGPPVPELRYVPSKEEADLAAAWYRCDHETGRVDRLLKEAREAERRIVAKYADRLAELNPRLEQVATRAAELVGRP